MSSVRLLGQLDPSFAWDGHRICDPSTFRPQSSLPVDIRGAVVSMEVEHSGTWRLLRDPLGINKLFWAKDPEGTILLAARPYLLVRAGCSFEEIQAIPAGSVIDVLPGHYSIQEHSLIPGSWFASQ